MKDPLAPRLFAGQATLAAAAAAAALPPGVEVFENKGMEDPIAPRLGLELQGATAQVFENDGNTALPKGARKAVQRPRAERKAVARMAAADLVKAGQATIVLAHIHPRSKRREIEAALNRGEDVIL